MTSVAPAQNGASMLTHSHGNVSAEMCFNLGKRSPRGGPNESMVLYATIASGLAARSSRRARFSFCHSAVSHAAPGWPGPSPQATRRRTFALASPFRVGLLLLRRRELRAFAALGLGFLRPASSSVRLRRLPHVRILRPSASRRRRRRRFVERFAEGLWHYGPDMCMCGNRAKVPVMMSCCRRHRHF